MAGNFADFHLGIQLPVAGAALGIFAAAEFLHEQFRALGGADHLGHDASTA